MVQLRFGSMITEARGSIAGTTYSRNRFGAYARARTVPVNPNSTRQLAARARMAFLAEQWRETPMTDAKRGAWATYASGIDATNKLGEDITLTGFNAFMMSNAVRLLVGQTFVDAGPTVIGLPAQDPLFAVAFSEATGITVTFDDTMDWADEDAGALVIELGKPQSPTRDFFGGPWRFHGVVQGNLAVPPTSPDGPIAVAAWTLTEGQKIWARARILRGDGRVSGHFGAAPVLVGA